MQQMMRSMQLTQTAHGRQIQTIRQTQREQEQQIDDIAEYLYQFHMRGYETDSDVSASGDAAATGDDGQ
jgi:predicted site-specific integrase-resolvase